MLKTALIKVNNGFNTKNATTISASTITTQTKKNAKKPHTFYGTQWTKLSSNDKQTFTNKTHPILSLDTQIYKVYLNHTSPTT
jgi:hypothetical protein